LEPLREVVSIIVVARSGKRVSCFWKRLRNFLHGVSPRLMESTSLETPSMIGPSPIQNVLLARRLHGPAPGETFTATSLPGHLLHFVLSGRVRQQCNGREANLEPGVVLWYHEDEWVEGVVLEGPWTYYSINFIAPTLPPPAYESRLFSPAPAGIAEYFAAIVEAWHNDPLSPDVRVFVVHSNLLRVLQLLAEATTGTQQSTLDSTSHHSSQLWWEIETRVRRDLSRPVSLPQLEEWSSCSAATVARACQMAVGQSPMRRVKQIRMSFARGLVLRSSLSFSEIAGRVGYPRVHEFSRDYKSAFGRSPSQERKSFNGQI
jgi:AraC-like DNA-binding protein